jgi:anti-sigma-K factor RskA
MMMGEVTPDRSECGEDAAAYVVGALTSDESERFRRHMASCAVCRDEVSSLRAVADALPLAAPQRPAPRGLRRKVMSDVRAETKGARTTGAAVRRRLPSMFLRPAFVAGAFLAALAIAGGLALSSGESGTRVVRASVFTQTGSAAVHLRSGHAELIVRRMPAPPAGKIYEVWLRHPGGAPSPTNALFSVTSSGAGAVDVPGDLHGVSEVLVTPERLGGSLAPTHAPVIVARLS